VGDVLDDDSQMPLIYHHSKLYVMLETLPAGD
jgi:hypothetical protein